MQQWSSVKGVGVGRGRLAIRAAQVLSKMQLCMGLWLMVAVYSASQQPCMAVVLPASGWCGMQYRGRVCGRIPCVVASKVHLLERPVR
jgi:hypothetical protein